MWRPGRTKNKAGENEAVTEATDLLHGHATERYARGRRGIPAWASVNSLAHADIQQLRRVAGDRPNAHPGGWTATLAYLAGEILARASNETELLDLQRKELIPLELQVLDNAIVAPRTPGQLATLIMATLDPRYLHRDR